MAAGRLSGTSECTLVTPYVNRSRHGAAAHRVDHHGEVDIGPRVDQATGLSINFDNLDVGFEPSDRDLYDGSAHSIIAAPWVANTDENDARSHDRSTVRSRK
jgi:hypothetical protein